MTVAKCVNVSPMLSILVSEKMATVYELQTVYSTEDTYLMFEILLVNKHNEGLSEQNDN